MKLDEQIYQKYKGYFNFYNQTYSWMKLYLLEYINERLEYEKVKQDFAYIDSFFKLPKELEKISEKEKEKAEEYVELFNDYLDKMNKSLTPYSVLHLFLATCALYVFQKEFEKHKYEIYVDGGLYYYQALNLNHINKLKVIFSKSYTMLDNEKRYIFINKELDIQADEKIE